MENKTVHIPVLVNEVLDALAVKVDGLYVDATLGAGGHSEQILKRGGKVLGIEADEHMLKISEERLKNFCPTLVRGNFENIVQITQRQNFVPVDGVLMDLGISNFHYETIGRGFSFKKSHEPLDLRLSTVDTKVTAATLLNILSEKQLLSLLEPIVGVHKAKGGVKRISRARAVKPFETVSDLQQAVGEDSPEIFLALRIAVNTEFEILEKGIRGAFEILKSSGTLAVISFHSLEDKIVMKLFKAFEKEGLGTIRSEKPIIPTEDEISQNPKSRSALLRIITKI